MHLTGFIKMSFLLLWRDCVCILLDCDVYYEY